jgi:hypothetical protein
LIEAEKGMTRTDPGGVELIGARLLFDEDFNVGETVSERLWDRFPGSVDVLFEIIGVHACG